MPAVRTRMSASSSTIRMSCAMAEGPRCGEAEGAVVVLLWIVLRRRSDHTVFASGGVPGGPESQSDACAAFRTILQEQAAAMVLHDLLDDGQAEAGALLAGGHIGLGEAVAVFRRQSAAVVLDDDGDGGIVGGFLRADAH